MRRSGIWAGHLELNALSHACKINIVVHQRDSAPYHFANFDSTHKTIHLSYHMGEHYNSVRPLNDKVEKLHKISVDPSENAALSMGVDYSKTEKIIMDSTGNRDLQYVRRVLKENDFDQDAAIEFIIMEQNIERTRQLHLLNSSSKASTASASSSSTASSSSSSSSKSNGKEKQKQQEEEEQHIEQADSSNNSGTVDDDLLMDCLPTIIESTGCDDIALISKILKNYNYDVNEAVNHILNHQNLEAALQEQDSAASQSNGKTNSSTTEPVKPLTRKEKRAIEQMEKRQAVEQGKYLTKKEKAKRAKQAQEAEFNKNNNSGDKKNNDDHDDFGDDDDGIDLEKVKAAKQQQSAGIRI